MSRPGNYLVDDVLHIVRPISKCYGRNVYITMNRINYISSLPLQNTIARQPETTILNLCS